MRSLAVIPARGASKSIPRKNIAMVGGKPLLAWTVLAAKGSPALDRIIVSTDDAEIAEVAKAWGAEVPFTRPLELGRDDTPGIEPILHAVHWLAQQENYNPDYVMVLQPTSPLRTTQDIEAAIQLALKKDADSVLSVSPARQHPYWMKWITPDGRLVDFIPLGRRYVRRQDLPEVYALNGAIYLIRRQVLLEKQSWYTPRTYAYIMPPERSLDIDTPWDLYIANLILEDRGCR